MNREKPSQIVDVVRSFTFKLNVGNYESRDFFCSQRAECWERDAAATSERLYEFCRRQVMNAVKQYQADKEASHADHR